MTRSSTASVSRLALAITAGLVGLALATPAHATLNACAAAKKLCVSKKTAALLKCHSKAEKPPAGLDPVKFAACIQKAKDKFDGGANPAKGCFAKLEAKYGIGCLTSGDTAALEAKVDAYVDDVVCALDSGGGTCPTPTPTPLPTPVPTPNCSNGMQDGGETGVDCGGGVCAPCGLGGGCASNGHCVASTVCSGGTCICAPGQADCNANPADGCEINLVIDPNHCGLCGNTCSAPNATETCNMTMCQIASCDVGYANCDGMYATGCEVATTNNNSHCGACNNVCPMGFTCVGSICQ